jgi:hypothetical protein
MDLHIKVEMEEYYEDHFIECMSKEEEEFSLENMQVGVHIPSAPNT